MDHPFPSAAWLAAFQEKLNQDQQYHEIAHNWEGDILFSIQADDSLEESTIMYLDLWHGTCRQARILEDGDIPKAAFELQAPYSNWVRILKGDLHPMQAMLTQKLKVKGNMTYMMRHVPTVLDFTRCAQEISQF